MPLKPSDLIVEKTKMVVPDREELKAESKIVDKYLYTNLKKLSEFRAQDNDMVLAYVGNEGTGKSTIALQTALTFNPDFSVNNIAFTIDEFLMILQKAKQGDIVIFDEAVMGLYSKDGQRNTTVEIEKLLTTYRWKNLLVILCIPDILMLTPYFRGRRVRGMVRTVLMKNRNTEELDKGFFKYYSPRKIKAIKRDLNTRRTKWPVPNFEGRFYKMPDEHPLWKKYLQLKKSRSGNKKISKKMMKEMQKRQDLLANSYSKKDIARMNNVSLHTVKRWMKEYKIWPKKAIVAASFGDTRILSKYYKKGIDKLPLIWQRVKRKRSQAMKKRMKERKAKRKVKKKSIKTS